MDFRFVHVYRDLQIDGKEIVGKIETLFPTCSIDLRQSFQLDDQFELSRISEIKQPFEKQPKQFEGMPPLYDGFVLQKILAEAIPNEEADHIHLIFTSLLTCTFDEDDWRYHGRTVVCGTPSIISTSGIVEGPAKPREFYLAQLRGMEDLIDLKKRLSGSFIDYNDRRLTSAALIYALQALFFFVSDGEPFCDDRNCLLYNAHWQKELIHLVEKGSLCKRHLQMVNKFSK